eukprot:3112777-Ditylum_brightwellii.AAC.1
MRVLPPRKVKNRHTKTSAKEIIHIVPADDNLPPLKIPPIYIPTPKGWKEQKIPTPHVIPPEPLVANQCLTLQVHGTQKRYAYAAAQITAQKYLAQAVMGEETGCALEYRHLIQTKNRE